MNLCGWERNTSWSSLPFEGMLCCGSEALFVLASDSESRSTQDNRPCTHFIHKKIYSTRRTLINTIQFIFSQNNLIILAQTPSRFGPSVQWLQQVSCWRWRQQEPSVLPCPQDEHSNSPPTDESGLGSKIILMGKSTCCLVLALEWSFFHVL